METNNKGFFVAIEGIDGSGKTTFINNYQKNNKEHVVTTRMPGGTEFAESLRDHARNADVSPLTQLLTYAACINDCLENTVAPAIDAGKIVISDRSYLSTYAYQVSQNQSLLTPLFVEILKAAPIKPDLTIFINIKPETAMERELAEDRGVDAVDRYSKMKMDQKLAIASNYRYLTNGNHTPSLDLWTKDLVIVDGNCSADELYRRIEHAICKGMTSSIVSTKLVEYLKR